MADNAGGSSITTPVRAEFQQKANLVSGKIGRREDEQAESIRNGKVEGTKISFEVSSVETTSADEVQSGAGRAITWKGR